MRRCTISTNPQRRPSCSRPSRPCAPPDVVGAADHREDLQRQVLPELTRTPLLRKLHGVPALRKVLNRIAGRKLQSTFGGKLRIFAIGGAALAPDVELFLREAGFPYAIGYGLTETAPLVAGCMPSTRGCARQARRFPAPRSASWIPTRTPAKVRS